PDQALLADAASRAATHKHRMKSDKPDGEQDISSALPHASHGIAQLACRGIPAQGSGASPSVRPQRLVETRFVQQPLDRVDNRLLFLVVEIKCAVTADLLDSVAARREGRTPAS